MTGLRPSILIVSNGHGEDAVGIALARELASHARIIAYPLVGRGDAFQDVPLLDPRRVLPSGGFGLRGSWDGLWADLLHGALRDWQAQRSTLAQQRGRHHLIIAIGDIYCLWMAARAGSPSVLIGTAKSAYNEPHRWVERLLMRRLALRVFSRDQATADALASKGVPARHLGNPLMDTVPAHSDPRPHVQEEQVVTLLPGSRADAYRNFALLLPLCKLIGAKAHVNFLCALAPWTELEQVRVTAQLAGWTAAGDILRSGATEVKLARSFGDAVQAAIVVVGLAGTANEQAAGLGKAVVAFPGIGGQYSRRFMALQKRLLGDALVTTEGWQEAAESVVRLLQDREERARRGNAGRQRMGPPGAAKKIAADLISLLAETQKQ